MDQYREAHLFVAAVRVLHHQKSGTPSVEDVCTLLNVSLESALAVFRRLQKNTIVELIEDPFSVRVEIADHQAIESLPRHTSEADGLSAELAQFMAKKKEMNKKVESIQAEMEKKRRELFSDIDEKLKKQLNDRKKG